MNLRTSRFLFEPTTEGGGGISDVEVDSMNAVVDRLGLDPTLRIGAPADGTKPAEVKTATPKPAAAAAAAAAPDAEAEAEAARLQTKADETGQTVDDVIAQEAADAEEARLEQQIAETGKTREEILEEEAAAGDENQPEFTDEQRAWIEQQNETSTTELTQVKASLEAAEAKVAELQDQVESAGDTALNVANVHPFFLIDDPAKLVEEENKLREFEGWCMKNWDGTEAVEAHGDQPAMRAYSKEEIRERYNQLKEIREKIVPVARESIAERKRAEASARKVYPELFDPKRTESKIAEKILRLAPGLKAVIPNIYVVIGDSIRGERIRIAQAKAKRKTVTPKTVGGRNTAPKVPVRPAPGGTMPRNAGNRSKETPISAQRFVDMGGDRNALVEMLRTANLPTLSATST